MYIIPTKEQIKRIEKNIREFFEQKNLIIETRKDVFELGTKLGFDMRTLSLPNSIDGVILVENKNKIIGVSNKLELIQARFVVAHELGHYIDRVSNEVNEDKILFAAKDTIFHNNTYLSKSSQENEMDYYAAAILVPIDSFKQDLERYGLKLESFNNIENARKISYSIVNDLCEKYKVNEELIFRRAVEVAIHG